MSKVNLSSQYPPLSLKLLTINIISSRGMKLNNTTHSQFVHSLFHICSDFYHGMMCKPE